MLTRLSATSPYVCDLNRGPIEPANRMASVVQSKKVSIFLEHKESLPKQTRTPLKLLAPEEVPLDSTAFTNDVDASLQPVWYSEQTIVDDQVKVANEDQEDIAAIIREQQRNPSIKPTSLSPIESQYSSVMEDNDTPVQPPLMHKSSTFTIEPESCTSTDSPSNESEKENAIEHNPPSEDSFRALEHLLGLGSAGTTVRESIKNNHDTLSLTVVTPTDIMNATSMSARASFVPKSGEASLPSSQTLAPLPTIESTDSTIPPSFLAENTVMEDELLSQDQAVSSFMPEESETSPKDDSNTDDDTNFSFELNDFGSNSREESASIEPTPVATPTPAPEPVLNIRAPTCADVAFRALIKPRAGGRISQPVKAQSPLAKSNKNRSSAPTSRLLRSSCRRASTEASGTASTVETEPAPMATDCLVNESQHSNRSLVQIVTVPEEDEENSANQTNSITLNLTQFHELGKQNSMPSVQSEVPATTAEPMIPMLSREYTYDSPKTRASRRQRSMLNQTPSISVDQTTMTDLDEMSSPSIPSRSMLGVLLTTPAIQPTPSIVSESMLGVLLTADPAPATPSKPTMSVDVATPTRSATPAKAVTPAKSGTPARTETPAKLGTPARTATPAKAGTPARSATPAKPETPRTPATPSTASTPSTPTNLIPQSSSRQTRQSARVSTQSVGKTNMDPLHSSTPSAKRHSVQMVSIGEEEQVSITVPPLTAADAEPIPMVTEDEVDQVPEDEEEEEAEAEEEIQIEMVPLNDTVPVPIVRTMEIGIQTTPSLDAASRRQVMVVEQQTPPSIQTKAVIHLQRNVRFQLTPTTDARLTEKEKLEEKLRGLKPDIVLPPNTDPLNDPIPQVSVATKAAQPKKKKKKATPKKAAPKKKATRSRSQSPKTKSPDTRPSSKDRKEKVVVTEETTPKSKRMPRKRSNTKSIEPTEPAAKRSNTKLVETSQPVPKRTKSKPTEAVPKRGNSKRAESVEKRADSKPIEKVERPKKRTNSKPIEPVSNNANTKPVESVVEPIEPVVKRARAAPRARSPSSDAPQTRTRSTPKSADKPASTEPKKVIEEKTNHTEIETMTVAALKNRLNENQIPVPKGAKKSELIALVLNIGNKTQKKGKKLETLEPIQSSIASRTRRHK